LLLLLLLLVPSGHVSPIYDALFPLLRITQSVAMLEILHALLGLVRASVLTTGMQVASRIMVVWGVMHMFSKPAMGTSGILGGSGTRPLAERGDWAFIGCLIAWGITECVRYGFFVLQLSGSGVPKWLLWLRYVSTDS
jgi:very-long-chain (3R)-3-hydroxyacyl-CoA dehydratase